MRQYIILVISGLIVGYIAGEQESVIRYSILAIWYFTIIIHFWMEYMISSGEQLNIEIDI